DFKRRTREDGLRSRSRAPGDGGMSTGGSGCQSSIGSIAGVWHSVVGFTLPELVVTGPGLTEGVMAACSTSWPRARTRGGPPRPARSGHPICHDCDDPAAHTPRARELVAKT